MPRWYKVALSVFAVFFFIGIYQSIRVEPKLTKNEKQIINWLDEAKAERDTVKAYGVKVEQYVNLSDDAYFSIQAAVDDGDDAILAAETSVETHENLLQALYKLDAPESFNESRGDISTGLRLRKEASVHFVNTTTKPSLKEQSLLTEKSERAILWLLSGLAGTKDELRKFSVQ